jgi:hypothetical protein
LNQGKTWIPTPAFARGRLYVGMTDWASRVRQTLGHLVSVRQTLGNATHSGL